MRTTLSSPRWLPAALARAAIVPTGNIRPAGPRHQAPEETPSTPAPEEVGRAGRHAEPEWSRELHDPARDGDPFAWLGFADPVGA